MGADPQALGGQPAGKPTYFKIASPPRSHPEFEYVIVQAAPKVGVCWVKGIGRSFSSDDFGMQTRRHVDDIEQALESKYGKPKKTDLLMTGSIWSEGKYWMMGLAKGDRMYAYVWDKPTDNATWKNISSIYLGAQANSSSDGFVAVEYEFANKPLCVAAEKKAAADAL